MLNLQYYLITTWLASINVHVRGGSFPKSLETSAKKRKGIERVKRGFFFNYFCRVSPRRRHRRQAARSSPPSRWGAEMEETAAAAAEKATSYSYWVREATGDAAPLPAPRKIDAADLAAKPAPTTLGSVWNKVPPRLALALHPGNRGEKKKSLGWLITVVSGNLEFDWLLCPWKWNGSVLLLVLHLKSEMEVVLAVLL